MWQGLDDTRWSIAPTGTDPIEPVTVDEAKRQCRVELDFHEDDAALAAYITVARQQLEVETGRQFMRRSLVLRMDDFPEGEIICLPRPPLVDVTTLQYVDTAGATQTWDAANYIVDPYSDPGAIQLAFGISWPAVRDVRNAVIITYRAGYGTSSETVPAPLRQAILLWVADMYRYREMDRHVMPDVVDRMIWPYRVPGVLIG